MNQSLPFDVSRCMGVQDDHPDAPAIACPQRETCARWGQRAINTGPRTSYVMWACNPGGFNSKIEETK